MKIYNVLFESNYENEDVHSFISSFKKFEDAKKCMEKAITDELIEGNYSDDDAMECVKRDGDDYACIYYVNGGWMFRITIYETELD